MIANLDRICHKLRDHAIQRLITIINTRHALCFHGGFWGGLLGARRQRTGEGESGRPGARQATLQIPIRSDMFLLEHLSHTYPCQTLLESLQSTKLEISEPTTALLVSDRP
eukprot:1144052-Pelagomonas_calceolata.AAC.8